MTATATQHDGCGAKASDGLVRIRIGEIDVAVGGDSPEVAEGFRRIYEGYPVAKVPSTDTIEVRSARDRARIFHRPRFQILGDGEPIGPPQPRTSVLPCVEWGINFRVVARRRDFLQIHAAVLSHRGQGMILAADSGSGKSTLACGLLAHGWQYLSDEFALIHPRTLQLHAFPKAICLKEGSLEIARGLKLPIHSSEFWVKGFKGPVSYVNPRRVGPEALGTPCPVRWILFPYHRPGAEPFLRPINPGQAVYELARHGMNRSSFGPASLRILAELVRAAECYVLCTGELNATCALLEGLVSH